MLKLVSPDPCLKVYYLITSTVSHTIHMSDLKKYIGTLRFSLIQSKRGSLFVLLPVLYIS